MGGPRFEWREFVNLFIIYKICINKLQKKETQANTHINKYLLGLQTINDRKQTSK